MSDEGRCVACYFEDEQNGPHTCRSTTVTSLDTFREAFDHVVARPFIPLSIISSSDPDRSIELSNIQFLDKGRLDMGVVLAAGDERTDAEVLEAMGSNLDEGDTFAVDRWDHELWIRGNHYRRENGAWVLHNERGGDGEDNAT